MKNRSTRRTMLVLFTWSVFALAAWPGQVAAQDDIERHAAAIQSVISAQIEAFRRDDAAKAYSFAAPEVRALFPNEIVFMSMVKKTYPPVYRPRQVTFGKLSGESGNVVQEVQIVGPESRLWTLLYRVVLQPDGEWRIASVIMASVPGSAT